MSYDLYVIPQEFCVDATTADRHMAEQEELPGEPIATRIAERINARTPRDDDGEAIFEEAVAGGDSLHVTAPYSLIQESRDLTVAEAFREGYGVFNPQNGLLLDPRLAIQGTVTTSSDGVFAVITPELVEHVVRGMQVDAFVILETAAEVYIQSKRIAADAYIVEYRDGGADRHFELATPATSPDELATLLQRWLDGGAAALSDREWAALSFE